ncbi:unknown [Choristoneura occidentalis granulovirus]|uniref:Uncharacterized protein n=1 Tax=Choristoneura occidentalis granulovirus TaxID=364745 RepID=Q1A4N3_9BBAC|nr:unknown [Choristoneura fumiferana granulovirus]ABC61197.1 unknown [Choristoneura fumiferana granulovirus]
MLDPNPNNIVQFMNQLPENVLKPEHLLAFRALKTLWCYKNIYNYNLLKQFLDILSDAELVEFDILINYKTNPKFNVLIEHKIIDPWSFDNNNFLKNYLTSVPKFFEWLQNYNETKHIIYFSDDYIINVLANYCVINTKDILKRLVIEMYNKTNRHDFYTSLRVNLLNANILTAAPLRNDACYRFTQFAQKIRNTLPLY